MPLEDDPSSDFGGIIVGVDSSKPDLLLAISQSLVSCALAEFVVHYLVKEGF